MCVFRGILIRLTGNPCVSLEDRYFILLTGRQCESIDRYLYDLLEISVCVFR